MASWNRKIQRINLRSMINEFKKEAKLSTGQLHKLIMEQTKGRKIRGLKAKAYTLIVIAMRAEELSKEKESEQTIEVI